jgi:hypothetical protein
MRKLNRNRSRNGDLLARVRLTESQRLAAQAAMQQGERITGLIFAAVAAIRSAGHGLERGFRALAGSSSTNRRDSLRKRPGAGGFAA